MKRRSFCKLSALCALALGLTACAIDADSGSAAVTGTGRYIVAYKNASGRGAALSSARALHRDLAGHGAVAVSLPAAAATALQSNPNIDYIEADAERRPLSQTIPYGIPMVQADQLDDGAAGNVTVCIIDSGYYVAHEDLPSATVTGTDVAGTGHWYEDGFGHGTHVAGTIAALNNSTGVVGVNPSGTLNLHIIRVFGDDGVWAYASDLVAALDLCEAAGPAGRKLVVSMSLGGSFKSRTEDKAFAAAYGRGVLSVAAAGNDGNTRMSYPASYDSVISVAAIDSAKLVAAFSQQNSQVELAAPGVGVLSTVPFNSVNTVTVGSASYAGGHIEGAALGTASGELVDGGRCAAAGAWSGKVVLCERGDIAFVDKVNNVLAGGGVAAAIYNNVPGGFLGTLGDGVTSSILAVSLSQEDGQALVAGSLGQSAEVSSAFFQPASGYEAWDGTSMATPHVSGVAALLWSNNLACRNSELRGALDASAQDLGAAGRDNAYGFGLVQAKAAADYLAAHPCGVCTPAGGSCTSGSSCCSGSCSGRPGAKTCR